MKLSLNNQGNRNRQIVWLLIGIIAVIVIVCSVVFLLLQLVPLQNLTQSLSPSANPTRVASSPNETATPIVIEVVATPLPIPPTDTPQPTITLEPTATQTPSLTPTPTRTSTPTRTPTNTPTPDPWVLLGQVRAACSTEFTFTPVSASRFKLVAISGGGDDKLISFNCCGSAGAAWLVNDTWLPVANPSLTLRVGETRETSDFGSAMVDRQRFNVGCNDNEQMDLRVYYLPAPAATITATLTATATPTATLTLTATTPTTATVTPTATLTLTSTTPATTTTTITPTATLTGTAAVTPTTTATLPPAPKGGIVFHKNDNGIDRAFVFNLDNRTITPLVDFGPVMDLAMSTNAPFGAWSPDNSRFAFISTVSSGASNILRLLDLKAGSTRPLYSSDTGGGLSSPTWSPDGTKIAFVRVAGNQHVWAIDAVNADGSKCSDKYECELTTNVNGEQFRGGMSWSKQGLFALAINSTGANNVFTMFADGNGRANLTNNPADNSGPAWSPDGKQIAFTSTRDGRPQIYVMPAPGGGPDANAGGSAPRRVSQGEAADFSPTWSPDGNWIAFASYRGGSTDLYMMDLSGGNVTRLTQTGGDHPLWSR